MKASLIKILKTLVSTSWGAAVLLVFVLAILFWRSAIPGMTLAAGDANLPTLHAVCRFLPEGLVTPIWAQGGLGVKGSLMTLTPGTLLMFIAPAEKLPDLFYIIGLLLLGGFGYLLIYDITASRFAATFGGLWMMLQPHMFSHILPGHMGHFAMVPWIPGILFFLRRAVRSGSSLAWGMAGFMGGLAGAASQHDVFLLFGILAFAYGLFLLIRRLTAGVPDARSYALSSSAGILLALLVFVSAAWQALFANLAGQLRRPAQAPSTAEAAVEMRTHERWLWATQWSVPVEESIDLAVPGFFGWGSSNPANPYRGRIGQTDGYPRHRQGLANLNDVSLCLGAVVLLGCVLAIAYRRRDPEMWFFLLSGLVAYLLACGKYLPFYRVFYALPFVDQMRNPIKWFYITSFAAGIVAAMAVAAIESRRRVAPLKGLRGFPRWLWGVPFLVLISAALLLDSLGKNPASFFYRADAFARLSMESVRVATVIWLLAVLAWWLFARSHAGSQARASVGEVASKLFLVVLLGAELVLVDAHYLPYQRVSDILPAHPFAAILNNSPRPYRILNIAGGHQQQLLDYQICYYDWDTVLPGAMREQDERSFFFAALRQNPVRLMDLCAVRYVASAAPLESWGCRIEQAVKTGAGQAVALYRYTNEVPRYYLVGRSRSATGFQDALRRVASADFNPRQEVVLDRDGHGEGPPTTEEGATGSCLVASATWHRVLLNTRAEAPQWLVGLDRFDGAWKAYVDGREQPIWRANALFRAVRLEAGTHTVEFRLPESGRLSMLMVASGYLLGALLTVAMIWTRRHRSNLAPH